MPVTTLMEGQYGVEGLFTSTPCMIGKDGIERVIELNLNNEELKDFRKSCDVIKSHIDKIK